jgi:predicted DNA-binding protein (MmcQ/YjbR family)
MNRQSLIDRIYDAFSIEPDYPWFNTPDAAVFRHVDSRKWFGLLMSVSPNSLRIHADASVDILNVKCDPLLIGSLRQRPGFLPAYHMNTELWITILLNDVSDDDIMELVRKSYELTSAAKGRRPDRFLR